MVPCANGAVLPSFPTTRDLQCGNRLPPLSSERIAVLTDIVRHHAVVKMVAKMVARKTEDWKEIAKAFNATGRPN